MPTQTELEFYKAFGIEPIELTDCSFINIKKGYEIGTDVCPAMENETLKCENCKYSKLAHKIYPEITVRQLLELIRLGLNYNFVIFSKTLEECKEKLLKILMYNDTDEIISTVRKIMGVE